MTATATAPRPRASVALKSYTGRLGGLPADRFFGSILWYTIAGTREVGVDGSRHSVPVRVHQDTLREWFDELSIDHRFLPPTIKKIDAFRAASSKVKREYEMPGHEGEQFAELTIREVRSDSEQVIRHVMREIRDERREQLSMEHMATLKFIRGGRTSKGKRHAGDHVKGLVLTRVRGVEREHVQELLEEFSEAYDDLGSHLHAPALRGVVRSMLASYNAVTMKSSAGLYFVHKTYWDQLEQLIQLLKRIGDGCLLEEVPLIDTEERRGSVREAFESEVEDDCQKLLSEIAKVNASSLDGRIAQRKYAEMLAVYNEVAGKVAESTEWLKLTTGRAADALELALSSVMAMTQQLE